MLLSGFVLPLLQRRAPLVPVQEDLLSVGENVDTLPVIRSWVSLGSKEFAMRGDSALLILTFGVGASSGAVFARPADKVGGPKQVTLIGRITDGGPQGITVERTGGNLKLPSVRVRLGAGTAFRAGEMAADPSVLRRDVRVQVKGSFHPEDQTVTAVRVKVFPEGEDD
jgi:hypothetical protein